MKDINLNDYPVIIKDDKTTIKTTQKYIIGMMAHRYYAYIVKDVIKIKPLIVNDILRDYQKEYATKKECAVLGNVSDFYFKNLKEANKKLNEMTYFQTLK